MTGNKAVLLSGHEFLLLLFKREAAGIVLPEEIAELSANEAELKTAMSELITDKYLMPGQNGLYETSHEIVKIMDVLTEASTVYLLDEKNHKFDSCFLYRVNMEAVSLKMDVHHKGWVRLEMVRFEEYIKELFEYPLVNIKAQRFRTGDNEPDKVIFITDNDSVDMMLDEMLEV
ncbi:hypothetical protein [Oribacterium sp. NK2B42]|uniref:hypothetical protein n=1 Tax=Oribacterium sp. NK2B42 TaxID=689781 RepID=UPI000405D36D|nr:hypothetical protein [Oribacterium sp. NK2B42]